MEVDSSYKRGSDMKSEIQNLIKIVQQSPKTGMPFTANSLRARKIELLEAIRTCEHRAKNIPSPSPIPDGCRLIAATYKQLVDILDEVLKALEKK